MTEGSWISLDVSPDGETIVFDFLGDLFTVPIAGGDATQLTSGMAFDAQPRFSPDGSRVVYTSDADGGQNVWVMASDGSDPVQISKGASNRAESPGWMPDGDYVVAAMGAFRLSGLPKLKLFHVDGGSGVELISEPDNLKTLGPAVSPDGRYIWYSRRTGDWQYNAQLPQYQLEAYDVETGERYPRSSRYGSALRPTLSPDGRWLVFGARHDEHTGLVLRDLGTGEERWLAYPVQHDDQESRATLDVLPGMSFTPDSRHLVASWGGGLWKVPVAGGSASWTPPADRLGGSCGAAASLENPENSDRIPHYLVRKSTHDATRRCEEPNVRSSLRIRSPNGPGAVDRAARGRTWTKTPPKARARVVRQGPPTSEQLDARARETEDEDDDETGSPRKDSRPCSAVREDPRDHTPSRQPAGEAWTPGSFRRRPRARGLGRYSALGRSHDYGPRLQHRQPGVPLEVCGIPKTTDQPGALRRDARDDADRGAGSRHPNMARLCDGRATLVRVGRTRLQLANARQRHAQRRVH